MTINKAHMKFGTKAIHAGVEPDPTTGAIMTPIYQTSTYVQAGPGDHKGYEYSRTLNPTRNALQKSVAELENGKFGLGFGSGMAASDAIVKLLSPGDEVIATDDLYGGTYRMFEKIFRNYGLKFTYDNMRDINSIEAHITDKTKMIWIETPTNPLLNIVDIEQAAAIAKKYGLILVVDNTFGTPYLQTPLDLGADIVIHSATKYLGGHSDVILGMAVCKDEGLAERLYFIQNTCGATPGPMDCFLVLRGIKTLHLRVKQHCENAELIARFLREQPMVDKVYWPGFEDHPNHLVAKKQMRHFGGMVSFTLKENTLEAGKAVMQKTKIFQLAESLGGVESLIGHPGSMTHAAIPQDERERRGVVDSLIRLSVGIEDGEDLVADLAQALI